MSNAVRVMGTVSRLNTADASFAINGLTVRYGSATRVPANATLAEGQAVTAWGTVVAPGGATGTAAGTTLQASRIRVGSAVLADAVVGATVQASGLVSAWDATSRVFSLQGLQVNAAAASVTPAGAALTNSVYVRVTGVLSADGGITARTVQVQQDNGGETARVRLKGAISSFLNTRSFVVRDVPVDASAIDIAAACPGQALASGVFVDVTAQLQTGTDVVKATALSCPRGDALPPYAMRDFGGTATGVSTASRTFTLVRGAGATPAAQAVRWTQQTAFKGITPGALAGTDVVVAGYLEGGTLVAREIRTPGQREADRFDSRQGDGEWNRYDEGFRQPNTPDGQPHR